MTAKQTGLKVTDPTLVKKLQQEAESFKMTPEEFLNVILAQYLQWTIL